MKRIELSFVEEEKQSIETKTESPPCAKQSILCSPENIQFTEIEFGFLQIGIRADGECNGTSAAAKIDENKL